MICTHCKKRPTRTEHHNSKFCAQCANGSTRGERTNLSKAQQQFILSNLGKVKRRELAARVGTSIPTLSRYLRMVGKSSLCARYPKALRENVLRFYEKHGRKLTEEQYPHVKVRSVVERHAHAPRQRRFRDNECIALAKMAGILPHYRQAAILARPRAHAGSIFSYWVKNRRAIVPTSIHGVPHTWAKQLCDSGYPILRHQCAQRPASTKLRNLILWVDVEKHLSADAPDSLKRIAAMMAQFQRWLFGCHDPRAKIAALAAVSDADVDAWLANRSGT